MYRTVQLQRADLDLAHEEGAVEGRAAEHLAVRQARSLSSMRLRLRLGCTSHDLAVGFHCRDPTTRLDLRSASKACNRGSLARNPIPIIRPAGCASYSPAVVPRPSRAAELIFCVCSSHARVCSSYGRTLLDSVCIYLREGMPNHSHSRPESRELCSQDWQLRLKWERPSRALPLPPILRVAPPP